MKTFTSAGSTTETPLDLPDGSTFQSQRVPIDADAMMAISEAWLPYVNASGDFEERRLARKSREQFHLKS